ncbi:MAG: DUF3857 domain-containing protein [Cyclobacteriaceae bacterium]
MKSLSFLIFSLYSLTCFSQATIKQLPEVTPDNFKSLKSSIDSSAKAQIIYDIGNTYFWVFDERIEYVFEKTTRIQILDKAGYDYATIEIPLYFENLLSEKIMEFTATSYNYEDGKVISETVNKKVLYEEQISQRWKRKKFAFSRVKKGTIIEYYYKITSPYNVHLRTWYFQHDIPVLHSKYKFSACPYYNYIVLNKGFIEYDFDTVYTVPMGFKLHSKNYETRVYEWELNNVPAIKNESFVPSDDAYKMKVEFQLESYYGHHGSKYELMTTWEQLIDELLEETESFGHYINSAKRSINQIIKNLSLNGLTDHEKVVEILKYVKNNYHWNKYHGKYATQTKSKFIQSKNGNVADINLLLHSLFTEAEIESSPILLSTRSHGTVSYQYPFLNLFNYVAVMVTDETGNYFVDATDPLLPIGMLPKKCINEYGLRIKKMKNENDALFFPLSPLKNDLAKLNQSVTLNLIDNKMKREAQLKLDGYKALNFRHNIKNNGIEYVYNELFSQDQDEITGLDVENLDQIEEPLVLKYSSTSTIENIGDKIIIVPFPENPFKENKLKKEKRIYPVDFGTITEDQYFFSMATPAEYKIDYIPESKTYKNHELSLEFNYIVQTTETSIQVVTKIKRDKTKYEPSEYEELKSFYDNIVKAINDNIILKKI